MKFFNILLYGALGALGGFIGQILVNAFWTSDLSKNFGLPEFQTPPSLELIIVTAIASGMIGGMRYKNFLSSLGCGCLIALLLLVGVLVTSQAVLLP